MALKNILSIIRFPHESQEARFIGDLPSPAVLHGYSWPTPFFMQLYGPSIR